MARHKDQPFYLRSEDGRARLEYTIDGKQRKVSLGLPYEPNPNSPKRSSPAECALARQAAEDRYRELTEGRVVEQDKRIKTASTFGELYALWIDPIHPKEDDSINDRNRKRVELTVRKAYASNIISWANDEARRPDGSLRWRGDSRTPLQRISSNDGPYDYLAYRLTQVTRSSMKKEKSNLVSFLGWCKAQGYIASVPEVKLPPGAGAKSRGGGRGVDIGLTPIEGGKIVAVMPVYSLRVSRVEADRSTLYKRVWSKALMNVAEEMGISDTALRKQCAKLHVPVPPRGYWVNPSAHKKPALEAVSEKKGPSQFLVRPFFEFMRLTGLRPVTIERLEIGRNWSKGQSSLILTNEDDKAKYGRSVPLPKAAVAILDKYAPSEGHIFGFHDRRRFVRDAAAIVFKDDPRRAKLFGSYHMRHLMGTFLAHRTNNVGAGMYVMGHTETSTFSGYNHGDELAARRLVKATEKELAEVGEQAAKWAAKAMRSRAG